LKIFSCVSIHSTGYKDKTILVIFKKLMTDKMRITAMKVCKQNYKNTGNIFFEKKFSTARFSQKLK